MITFNKDKIFGSLLVILILVGVIFYLYWDTQRLKAEHKERQENPYVTISYVDRESADGFIRVDVGDAEIHIPLAYKPSSVTTKYVTFIVRWSPNARDSKNINPLHTQLSNKNYAIDVVVSFPPYDISDSDWKEKKYARIQRIFESDLESRDSQEFENITEFITKSNGNIAYHVLKLEDKSYSPNSYANCSGIQCMVSINLSKFYSIRFGFKKEVLYNYGQFIYDMTEFTKSLLKNTNNRESNNAVS